MSRVGKKMISLPSGVSVDYDQQKSEVTVKGGLGTLTTKVYEKISLVLEGNTIEVKVENPSIKEQRSIWGTTRSIIQNMVEGVNVGFTKELELNGVGFKMDLGQDLVLNIGFSHPVKVEIPTGIKLTLNKNLLVGNSIDKQLLGDFFSKIFFLKPCDVYKHKGFKYPGRFYKKKVGKKGK